MDQRFIAGAAKAGFHYVLSPTDDFSKAAMVHFIQEMPFVPDHLLEQSKGDVMYHNAETGNLAFPTPDMRAWAIKAIEVDSLSVRVYDLIVH